MTIREVTYNMARSASQSRGVSFRQLSASEEAFDWGDEEDQKPRPNPFNDDLDTFSVIDSDAKWVSKEEVADFMKQSRNLSLVMMGDDEEELGQAWGGSEFSLASAFSHFLATSLQIKQSSSFEGPKVQSPPKRPPVPSSSVQRSRSVTTTSLSSSFSSSSSSTHVSAAAVRNQTPNLPTTQQAAVQSVSSSIKDVMSSTPQVSVTEYNKLQAEIRQLRRDLQAARKDKTAVPSVQETVKNIIRGQPYTLEVYKSLKINWPCWTVPLSLFLKKTVRQGVLHDELRTRPKALDHLCKYLSEHHDYTELTELYRSVGKYEEAAMLQFNQALKAKAPGVRLTKLKYILRHYFEGYPQLDEQTTYLTEYIDLLEQQILIEDADARAELERKNHVMVSHPRQASLPLCSVIVTLYYCCRYHFGEPENLYSSPLAIRAKFKLSAKQYEWTALSSRAKLKQWKGLEQMFTAKGWLGSVKMKSVIGFTQVIEILHQHGAPQEVLSTYLKLIDDRNQRVSLATKTKCHDVAIETIVAMKDRQQLDRYRSNLKGTAPQQAKISEYLNNSQLRWKN
ncbi:spermatogenesis-defective protein 39 [Desmophyllum pertusum]|uniref:Spermatogenesis-defective protein 39 n=1 Tax=Desmophyllum pertusum TaxID=174260 RepID=A0A9W9ZQ28_9CNID|nr:spermatogenesis-defective protein 39 [Desmophyllum pertusum]